MAMPAGQESTKTHARMMAHGFQRLKELQLAKMNERSRGHVVMGLGSAFDFDETSSC